MLKMVLDKDSISGVRLKFEGEHLTSRQKSDAMIALSSDLSEMYQRFHARPIKYEMLQEMNQFINQAFDEKRHLLAK